MPEQRNIVIIGGSVAGISSAHYILKHTLPALQAKGEANYHVYLISSSTEYFFRIASPRGVANPTAMGPEKLFYDIQDGFKQYSSDHFSFIHATATGLDTNARVVSVQTPGSKDTQSLNYHALVVATGSRTPLAAHSLHSDSRESRELLSHLNKIIDQSQNVIIAGGGPTGVETAGEIGEYLNGKPGWFSTPTPKAKITLVTSGSQLLPTLRPAIGLQAEKRLKRLGVEVLYKRRIVSADTTASGSHTTVRLDKGDALETDLYLPTMGVTPNSGWLPASLLDSKNKVQTNAQTLRVDVAGPRVYAVGDISSASRNTILDIYDSLPAVMINLKRDLLAYSAQNPSAKPVGEDKVFAPNTKEMMIVPIGSGGGVGAIMGFKVPSWFVWLVKSRDFFVGSGVKPFLEGEKYAKEFK